MRHKIGVLVYIKRDGMYLMIHRNKKKDDFHKGFWVAPGGKREDNESLLECARREMTEETGLLPLSMKFCGFLHFPHTERTPVGCEWVDFVYQCDDFTGTVTDNCPEGDLKWVKESDLLDLPMWEGDLIFTKYVMEGRFFSLSISYDGSRLISVTDEDII